MFYLSEKAALKVATKSDTKAADKVVDEFIDALIAVGGSSVADELMGVVCGRRDADDI